MMADWSLADDPPDRRLERIATEARAFRERHPDHEGAVRVDEVVARLRRELASPQDVKTRRDRRSRRAPGRGPRAPSSMGRAARRRAARFAADRVPRSARPRRARPDRGRHGSRRATRRAPDRGGPGTGRQPAGRAAPARRSSRPRGSRPSSRPATRGSPRNGSGGSSSHGPTPMRRPSASTHDGSWTTPRTWPRASGPQRAGRAGRRGLSWPPGRATARRGPPRRWRSTSGWRRSSPISPTGSGPIRRSAWSICGWSAMPSTPINPRPPSDTPACSGSPGPTIRRCCGWPGWPTAVAGQFRTGPGLLAKAGRGPAARLAGLVRGAVPPDRVPLAYRPARARRLWEQFRILHPELGPEPWPARFRELGDRLP